MKKIFIFLSLISTLLSAGKISESLFIPNDNLTSYLSYISIKDNSTDDKTFVYEKNFNKNSITYAKPDNFYWTTNDGNPAIVFPKTAGYSMLGTSKELKKDLSLAELNTKGEKEKDNYYMELDGGSCLATGCLREETIISVVVPVGYEIVTAEAFEKNEGKYAFNKDANFKLIENTLTLYSKNTQGAYVKLWFKDISNNSKIYKSMSSSFASNDKIQITKTGHETKILMPMDNVFKSGDDKMNATGKAWLKTIVSSLKDSNYKEIRIEGHTDNVPVKGKFSSNWDLSSARSIDAVNTLISQGIESNKVAAVGYSDTRPLVSNSTSENKAKNRRIEIIIIGQEE